MTPVDRLHRVHGMERGHDQVPGLGRGNGNRDRLQVAHFANEDDVGILAQRRPQKPRRSSRCPARSLSGLIMLFLLLCKYSMGSSRVMMYGSCAPG